MAEGTTIQKIVAFSLVYLFAVSCANQIPPGGGPPDSIPPEIIEVLPEDQTVGYTQQYVEITFSEYVNKRSVQESIFISPNIEGIIEYNWSGKTVELELPDTLDENTTYTITVGTDVEDINNRNKMAESYTFAFSTGDKIDKGTILGTVVDPEPFGIMIYAYKVDSDTLNPSKQKPNYVTQTGENGKYKLTGLSEGKYRVFAVRDEYKDYIYDPTQDEFGAPFTEISLSSTDSLFAGLNYKLSKEDTSRPRVFGLTMTDNRHILIEFSEPIDSTAITADNFFIYDSTNGIRTDVEYFFKGRTKPKNYLVAIDDTLQNSDQHYLISENLIDIAGNITDYESTSFVRNTEIDTLINEMFNMSSLYPGGKIDFKNGKLRLRFLDGFSQTARASYLSVVDENDSEVIPKFKKVDDATIDLIFTELKPDSKYKVLIDNNGIMDVAGNFEDTTTTHIFSTITKLDFSGLSGEVIAPDNLKVVVTITNLSNQEIEYSTTSKLFDFKRVFPGSYRLSAFNDINQNGIHDNGSVYPFVPAEKFVFYPDTLELKARWPVGDVKLLFE